MEDNLENKAEEAANDVNKAAEESWNTVGETASQAAGEVKDAGSEMKASAEEWSKEVPAAPAEPVPPAADRWGTPETPNPDEPGRWTGELYSPESAAPTPEAKPAEPKVVDFGTPTPPQKKPFPWWGIVLIVLAVLLICILCPLGLILSGLLGIVRSNTTGMILPLFF